MAIETKASTTLYPTLEHSFKPLVDLSSISSIDYSTDPKAVQVYEHLKTLYDANLPQMEKGLFTTEKVKSYIGLRIAQANALKSPLWEDLIKQDQLTLAKTRTALTERQKLTKNVHEQLQIALDFLNKQIKILSKHERLDGKATLENCKDYKKDLEEKHQHTGVLLSQYNDRLVNSAERIFKQFFQSESLLEQFSSFFTAETVVIPNYDIKENKSPRTLEQTFKILSPLKLPEFHVVAEPKADEYLRQLDSLFTTNLKQMEKGVFTAEKVRGFTEMCNKQFTIKRDLPSKELLAKEVECLDEIEKRIKERKELIRFVMDEFTKALEWNDKNLKFMERNKFTTEHIKEKQQIQEGLQFKFDSLKILLDYYETRVEKKARESFDTFRKFVQPPKSWSDFLWSTSSKDAAKGSGNSPTPSSPKTTGKTEQSSSGVSIVENPQLTDQVVSNATLSETQTSSAVAQPILEEKQSATSLPPSSNVAVAPPAGEEQQAAGQVNPTPPAPNIKDGEATTTQSEQQISENQKKNL